MPTEIQTQVHLRHKTEKDGEGKPVTLKCHPVDAKEHLKNGFEVVSAPATFGKVQKNSNRPPKAEVAKPSGASIAGLGDADDNADVDADAPVVGKPEDFKDMTNDEVAKFAADNGIELGEDVSKKKDRVSAIIAAQQEKLDTYLAAKGQQQ